MAMVNCEFCGKMVSANAEACPHCRKQLAVGAQGACRVCGTMLPRKEYRTTRYYSTIVNGSSSGRSYISHKACPKCGEPKPLYGFWDTPLALPVWIGFGAPAALFWLLGPMIGGKPGGMEMIAIIGAASWGGLALAIYGRRRGQLGALMMGLMASCGLVVLLGIRAVFEK